MSSTSPMPPPEPGKPENNWQGDQVNPWAPPPEPLPGQVPPPPLAPMPPAYTYGVPVYTMGRPTSGMAIASMVLSFFGCFYLIPAIIALILGLVGLNETKNDQKSGRGMAIAGVVISIIWILIAVLFGIIFLIAGTFSQLPDQ